MSEDTSINFYRSGTVDILIKGWSFMKAAQSVKWSVMLKGPRMGYTSFSIISSPYEQFNRNIPSTVYLATSLYGKAVKNL